MLTYFEDPAECLESSWYKQKRIKEQDFPSVSEESLFEFEYSADDNAFEMSVAAWMKILRTFLSGVLDENILRQVLEKHRNSRSPPLPHSDLVYNYEYLESELVDTKWEKYLRR